MDGYDVDVPRISKELKIIQKLSHPNIFKVDKMLMDKKYFYIVSEYLKNIGQEESLVCVPVTPIADLAEQLDFMNII